jgi:protein phosphatase PTC1
MTSDLLTATQLWDVCTDQEAVDLIRNVKDAQEASKMLVDHALSRFSTDNLSCMVVRFDANLIRDVVERRIDPIGVEGDTPSKDKGGVSEADKIIEGTKKQLNDADANGTLNVNLGLNAKLKADPAEVASTESPGPEVTVDDTLNPLNPKDAISTESESNPAK